MPRSIDIVISFILIIFLMPIMIIISMIILFCGRKPVFRHKRIGFDGVEFSCLKFTSMKRFDELSSYDLNRVNIETIKYGKVKNDPRITFIGKFLRKTSIDELPQLFNVLLGDMSLVGPRPITIQEIHKYGKFKNYYFSVRPGMTGLWQVSGRSNITFRRRVAMDVFYIRNKSAQLLLLILIKTIFVVVIAKGAA
ncbi:TPA: sugar transferase [Raoultella ornithinolytica]